MSVARLKPQAACSPGASAPWPATRDGDWIGRTLFVAGVRPDTSIYTEEILGPILVTSEVRTLDEAIELVHAKPNGNGDSLFTSSGSAAHRFEREVALRQVGINVPSLIPLPFFSCTGCTDSFFGDQHVYGQAGRSASTPRRIYRHRALVRRRAPRQPHA